MDAKEVITLEQKQVLEIEEIVLEKSEEGLYKKIILEDEIMVGAIWMGTKRGIGNISRAITQKRKVGRWKYSILKDDFDFSVL